LEEVLGEKNIIHFKNRYIYTDNFPYNSTEKKDLSGEKHSDRCGFDR